MKSMIRMLALSSCITMALPAMAQFDGDQSDSSAKADDAGPAAFLAEGLFAAENCDALALPQELEKIIDRVTHKVSPHAIVCVLPGQAVVSLNLKHPGLRIVALGTVVLQGAVYVNAPTVLFGLTMDTIALDKGAAGSVLAANVMNKAITNTNDVIMIGNVNKAGKIEGPLGHISAGLHLPDYAQHLNLAMGNFPLSGAQNERANVAGWLPRSSLSTSVDTEAGPSESSLTKATRTKKQEAAAKTPGGLGNVPQWFAERGLVAHTSPNSEDTTKRGQDVVVYRNPETLGKALRAKFFVPMHTGRPDLHQIGVIFGLTQ